MSRRVIVAIILPLEMGAVGRIMKTVAREYPDATVGTRDGGFAIIADDDVLLSREARRRLARERMRAARAGEKVEP